MATVTRLDRELRSFLVVILALYVVNVQVDLGVSRSTHELAEGEFLYVGDSRVSKNGQFRLVMQTDCNLVLYEVLGDARWASNTYASDPKGVDCYFTLQTDGNGVLYNNTGSQPAPVFATGTLSEGDRVHHIEVQDNAHFSIFDDEGKSIWVS